MTSAEFLAITFWPILVLMTGACALTKGAILRQRYFLTASIVIFFGYFALWAANPQSSIIEIWDFMGLGVVFGALTAADSLAKLVTKGFDLKKGAFLLFGVLFAFFFASELYQDFFHASLTLEGRAENPRIEAQYRGRNYLIDIAGHTVKATTSVYERLSLKPYVRAEIARGSNYIYKIEYLAN
jgi:hypothetical protein